MIGPLASWLGDAMALGCALAWACSILLFRRAKDVDPAGLNLFKNVLATGMLVATLIATGGALDLGRSPRDWALLAVSGVLGLAVGDTLFLAGLRRLDASVAAVTDCTYSPTVVALSALLLGERLGPGIAIGAPLIVLGLLLVSWRGKSGGVATPIDRRGVALAIAGVMSTALGVVVAKPALGASSLIEATTIRLVAGTSALFAFQAAAGQARRALSVFVPSASWRVMIPATILGAYVAMILWLGGMKYGTASRAALLNQSAAVWVLLLSALLGEKIPRLRWVGAGLAVFGVAVVIAA